MADQSVRLEIDDAGVATVSLARPEVHNAFDDALIARLSDLLAVIRGDPAARVLVLRSEGRSFSAGADLGWMRRMASYSEQQNVDDALALARMLRDLAGLPVPTIAAVQGAAFGGGAGLVACCDVVIASESSRFAFSEVKLGLIPATISPFVIRAIGARRARALFLTGEVFDAAEAHRIGLAHRVVEAGALAGESASLAATIASYGPATIGAIGDLVDAVADRPFDDALLADTAARIAAQRASVEGSEGVAAFLEKRAAAWPRRRGP